MYINNVIISYALKRSFLLNYIVLILFSLVSQNITLSAENKNNFKNTINIEVNTNYLDRLPANDYILGPGDQLKIIVSREYPELTTNVTIDGEGTIYLPRLSRIFIEGLSINELNSVLNKAYREYVKYPSVESIVRTYRPIKVQIIGEVQEPGLITLDGSLSLGDESKSLYFPSLFDAIQRSGGITEFTDLSKVQLIRKNRISRGGGKITTKINFEDVLIYGDISKNLRIYDSDIIKFNKSLKPNQSLLSKAITSKLNPKFIDVFVLGRVNNPGKTTISRASVLSDAIDVAGGMKAIKGPLKFIRFNNDGSMDKRKFAFRYNAKRGSFKNPYLKNGDLIVVGNNILNTSNEIITDLTQPFLGIFSTYSVIKAITD